MKRSSRTCWTVAGMVGVTVGACAGEQIITLRDWTGLGFAPQVFGYDVPIDLIGAINGFFRLNVTQI